MGWPKVRLADCCQIKPPKSEAKKLINSDDLVSFVPMNNLGINSKQLSLEEDKELSAVSGSYTYFADGDVLLAKITPCFENGKLGIASGLTNGIGFGSSEFMVFRSDGRLLPEYLYYFFLRPSFRDKGKAVMTGAVGHKRVPKDYIEETKISLPPIPEQKRIVAILDQAFADIDKARALTEQNLKNARELFESYLQQVFSQRGEGWKTTNLKAVTSKIGSGATPKGGKSAYKVEGISLIRSMNVHDRLFIDKDLAFIDDDQAEKLSNVVVEKNDVLLNITGASVARCCVAPERYLPARVNQHVSIIRLDKQELLPKFLNYGLTSKFYKDQLLGIGEAGSTRQAITKAQIESFEVSYPKSLDQQEQYIRQLNELESQMIEMKKIYEKKCTSLDELKKSLLQKAFTGELTSAPPKNKDVA